MKIAVSVSDIQCIAGYAVYSLRQAVSQLQSVANGALKLTRFGYSNRDCDNGDLHKDYKLWLIFNRVRC